MSNFVEQKLEAWGLSDYIEKFQDEQIDEEAFLHMPESMIKELIPIIGKRFYFLQNRKRLLQNENEHNENENSVLEIPNKLCRTESDDTCSIGSSLIISLSVEDHGKILRKLLLESSCGKKILCQTRLTSSDRNKLCHIIIDKLLCKSKKITSEQFQEWSAAIVSIFKYEKESTYYVPSNIKFKRLANGKLWDKYNNLKKYIKQPKNVDQNENTSDENIPDCQEALLKLHAIQPDDPNLENLWKKTCKARNRGTSITNYYEEYPILKTSFGAVLLKIDFEIETGIDAHVFKTKWFEIAPYIIDFATQKEICLSLCKLRNDVSPETLSLLILPYLFQPYNVKTGNKKNWKPSKAEVAESFICRIPSIAEYVTYKEGNSLVCHKKMLLRNYTNYSQIKSVCFGNVMLQRKLIILIGINDNFPLLAEIADICKINTNVSLLSPSDFIATVKYLFASYFDNHYQAYTINISEKYSTINFDCMQYFKVYTLIQKEDGNCYISY